MLARISFDFEETNWSDVDLYGSMIGMSAGEGLVWSRKN